MHTDNYEDRRPVIRMPKTHCRIATHASGQGMGSGPRYNGFRGAAPEYVHHSHSTSRTSKCSAHEESPIGLCTSRPVPSMNGGGTTRRLTILR